MPILHISVRNLSLSIYIYIYIYIYSMEGTNFNLNLSKTLILRALMICSESKLDCEVSFITETLCNNGFSEDSVRSVIRDKIAHFHKTKVASVQKCPVYIRLPWLGDISDRFANQISACVRKCYFSSNLRVLFRTRTVLPSGRKDVLPAPQHSSALIYSFRCVCGLQYIRRTNQRLGARIKQHVPTKIRLGNYFADHINNTYGSSMQNIL